MRLDFILPVGGGATSQSEPVHEPVHHHDYVNPGFLSPLAVEESDIIDLEKRYWLLKAQSRTGRFDLETFVPLVSPPIHASLSEGNQEGFGCVNNGDLCLWLLES